MLIPYNQRRLKKMSTKNYNMLSENGMDDMEYVKQYNLDPAIAYTPKINDVMLDIAYSGNVRAEQKALMDKGMTQAEAFKIATGIADKLLNEGKKSLSKLKKQRGY